jgi:hypothetical protein
MYPVLRNSRRLEGVLESGGAAPRILNLGTTWRSVITFKVIHPMKSRVRPLQLIHSEDVGIDKNGS